LINQTGLVDVQQNQTGFIDIQQNLFGWTFWLISTQLLVSAIATKIFG
jgi:hypothetical protein